MSKSAATLATLLLTGAAWAAELPPPPPAPGPDCKDCLILAPMKEVRDFSYEPLLTTQPFGENNCGEVRRESGEMLAPAALQEYLPFQQLRQRTTYRRVAFEGAGEAAINCMILLSKVKQARLAAGLLDSKVHGKPTLYGWKNIFLRYDPRSGRKLVWIPVMPTPAEQTNMIPYLEASARKMFGSFGPLEELYAADVHLTVGYKEDWVTVNVIKQDAGYALLVDPGMDVESRLQIGGAG